MPWFLWILLLVVVAAIGVVLWRRRSAPPPAPPVPLPPVDDLGSLGLSAVRPATTTRSEPEPASVRPSMPEPRTPDAHTSEPRPSRPAASLSTVSEARPRAAAPDDAFVRDDSPLWADRADAVRPLLRSLAVALGGGVAVLRYEDNAYPVDALLGVPGVRSPRALPAGDHALHRIPQDVVLSILGPESRRSLSYYADPDAAVGQAVARALAPPPARRVLLVADVPPGQGNLDDDALALVARYGDLLAALTTLDAPAEMPPRDASQTRDEATADPAASVQGRDPLGAGATDEAADVPAPLEDAQAQGAEPADADRADAEAPDAAGSEPAGTTDDAPLDDEAVVPRAVVLQRAIDEARDAERPLAFALVTLADADAVLRGDPLSVARAEAALRDHFDGPLVRAVEPFGDLMLGVFLEAAPDEARAWAEALAEIDTPLLIGLVETVGDDPAATRAAATSALEEAYHQGGGLAVTQAG